ncbi:MAG: hypothetical protein FRX49_06349 [Trebouxia sp. A1-2]|nr:MAG: hypothetical protein FRX49_06349 [Trebouxia sp. A1-2]
MHLSINALALRVSFLLIASATLFSIILRTSQDVREACRILTRSSLISDTAWSSIFLGSSKALAAVKTTAFDT